MLIHIASPNPSGIFCHSSQQSIGILYNFDVYFISVFSLTDKKDTFLGLKIFHYTKSLITQVYTATVLKSRIRRNTKELKNQNKKQKSKNKKQKTKQENKKQNKTNNTKQKKKLEKQF